MRIDFTAGGATINLDDLADQLEYESGEVRIKPAAMPILEQLTDFLTTTAAHQQVRVEGHSDNMEIGPTLKGQFPTNWELSKARAAEIVRYLVQKGGMDSAKLSAVGYGASRPVASNATDEGRKKNRRIEVVLESIQEALPAKAPLGDLQPKPAQVSLHDGSVGTVEAAALVPASSAQTGPTSSEAGSDHATSSDLPTPASGAGDDLPSPPPGL
jgi:chemotaxis protein MotB